MDISGYIRRKHIRNLTEKNIELIEKNRDIIIRQFGLSRFKKIETAIYKANDNNNQIKAYALLRYETKVVNNKKSKIFYTLADDIKSMKNKPNTPNSTDFNLFDVNETARRLQPDLTIKTK